jgi:hypothetical protein
METLNDIFVLVKSALASAVDLLGKAVDAVIVEEPFLQGVEATIAVMLVIRYREAILSFIDRVPLLGSGLAWVIRKAEAGAMMLLGKARDLLKKGYDATLGRLFAAIMRKDKEIRED